ncbi:Polyprotein of retroviral origin [Caligus rogercresseyi]|uniref:Polyprotein of retroviral origin n=1 Tax=Caligus rogercresseyi TaxID=217165 RepID=A0A7T8GYA9_CALRO|nr:Polyprotein of retroviral origin [Caligus rogercresseyi]
MNPFVWFEPTFADWRVSIQPQMAAVHHKAKGNIRIKLAFTNVDEDPYVLRSGMELGTINAITQYTPTNHIAAMNNAVNVNPPYWELEMVDPNVNYEEAHYLLADYIGLPKQPQTSEKMKKEIDDLFGSQIKANSDLTANEKNLLYELLVHFKHILSKDSSDVGRTEVPEFAVDTGDNSPIKPKVRPMNPAIHVSTASDNYPVAHSMELLTDLQFGEAKYFVAIDMAGAYFAVPVKEEGQEKLTIVSPFGTYKFLRMPFGPKNACGSGTYTRLMR